MEIFKNRVNKLSRILDMVAGWAIAASMVLVVTNVLLSNIFGIKVLGKIEYEYVGFLAAVAIGLGIAYCAVNDGHIAITILTDKMGKLANNRIDLFCGIFAGMVMGIFTVEFIKYAYELMQSGEVSATTRTPAYIFVMITGAGFVAYSLVILAKSLISARRLAAETVSNPANESAKRLVTEPARRLETE